MIDTVSVINFSLTSATCRFHFFSFSHSLEIIFLQLQEK